MERKIFAILNVDEETLLENYGDSTVGAVFEEEMEKVALSGITVNSWTLMDEDESDLRQSYLNYLADWIDRKSWADEHSSPLSYEKWQNRPVMLANANICVAMIEDLGEGEPTHLGERTSRYFHLARSRDGQPDRFCSAALIERTVLETGHEQEYYELHVINDIDMTSSRTYMTTYKSRLELSELVQSILKKIEEMTY